MQIRFGAVIPVVRQASETDDSVRERAEALRKDIPAVYESLVLDSRKDLSEIYLHVAVKERAPYLILTNQHSYAWNHRAESQVPVLHDVHHRLLGSWEDSRPANPFFSLTDMGIL